MECEIKTVIVSTNLIHSHLKETLLQKMFQLLETDVDVQTYLYMSNVMAVKRLMYNDHGPLHSRIVSGSSLEIFRILTKKVTPSIVKNGEGHIEDAKLVVLCGAYLHDIGNAIHRNMHHFFGYSIADPLLERLLPKVYGNNREHILRIKTEILHCIFSSDEVQCLTMEAGAVKVGDGADMAEGRARIPYDTGKVDIHSLSALSIRCVEINEGKIKPIQILVNMDNPAGVFQIEAVLEQKIKTSGLKEFIEVVALKNGKEIKTIKPEG